ncbi:MAG: haloacid dehalogenase, partial [Hyphomonas sp.]
MSLIVKPITPDQKAKRDPVCGMMPKADSPHRLVHEGAEVLFCSAGCKIKFEADPSAYPVAEETRAVPESHAHGHSGHGAGCHHHAATPAPKTAAPGSQWTCPMHPEILRDGPGDCPICGMALEPLTPSA